jgi:hypothetical protein
MALAKMPQGSADFSQHPLERILLLIINAGETLLGLVCFAAAIAGATGQLEGAGASFNLMFVFVGCVTFVVGMLGLCGVLKYNNLMYVYFLVMVVSTIFVLCVVLFVVVNKDIVLDEVRNEAVDQWNTGNGFDDMPTILQNLISNTTAGEECGDFGASDDDNQGSCVVDDIPDDGECTGDCVEFCDCWDYLETLISDTYLTYCLAAGGAIILFMIIATVASLRVVGIHDIIKRTQHIVNIALAINGLVTIIFGVAVYVTLNDENFPSGAYAGYFVIAIGAFILLTGLLGFCAQKGGNKPLQMIYIVICGLMTLLALTFALIAFFGSAKVQEQALACESCKTDFQYVCNATKTDENIAKAAEDFQEDLDCGEGSYETFVNNAVVAFEGAGFICLFVFLFMIIYDIGAVIVLRTESEMGEETMAFTT